MGLYLNPGNEAFAEIVANDIYVDKTGLIAYMNQRIGKAKHLIASSRPRRFGKTMAVQMLAAYYSRGCDSRELFLTLNIAAEKSFEKHLNKYDVISLDIQWMKTSAAPAIASGEVPNVIAYIHREVIRELREAYPEYVGENAISLPVVLADINVKSKKQFVIIIDEWDCLFREDKGNSALQEAYIDFLRGLFKGRPADEFVKLAYITGILPIKKYKNQSALNNFREFTMIYPGEIADYIGFTEKEVMDLCQKNDMPFSDMQRWYDGYLFSSSMIGNRPAGEVRQVQIQHIYSPNSVMEAIDHRDFQDYWSQTETYEDLKLYIEMNFDGLREKIVDMLGGKRCGIVTRSFQNDMTSFKSASDVLTLLVHLGYLAYDSTTSETFIPNEEVRDTFILSVMESGWDDVYKAIRDSEKLLDATLAMDEDAVANMIQNVHMKNSSSLLYNHEASLASIIQVAYYSAAKDYTLIREFPSGEGFADMVFVPKAAVSKPALVVELKWDKSAEGAIRQIKDRKYMAALKEYADRLLLVGINYDKKTKKHQCKIEKYDSLYSCFLLRDGSK